ncbi:hypothetical protein F8388_005605 [Cannabis sativa]|uniref:Uncharacterized protein n=1 Tax=Cannabis sativa TaxID=3483 RepID=A0A7J6EK11_CANSA|nr:hypothetical protein F8388_005605 [Cannabis sativa]
MNTQTSETLVPSETACLANSPGSTSLTAVWISRDVIVGFLLYLASFEASWASFSKISLMKEFMMPIALLEIPISGSRHSSSFSSSSCHRQRRPPWGVSFQPLASSRLEPSRRRWTSSPPLASSPRRASSLPLAPSKSRDRRVGTVSAVRLVIRCSGYRRFRCVSICVGVIN